MYRPSLRLLIPSPFAGISTPLPSSTLWVPRSTPAPVCVWCGAAPAVCRSLGGLWCRKLPPSCVIDPAERGPVHALPSSTLPHLLPKTYHSRYHYTNNLLT